MYTKLRLEVSLREDTPESAIELLHIMCKHNDDLHELDQLLNENIEHRVHPLFGTWRGLWQFRCDGGFGDWETPYFVREEDRTYTLRVSFSVKNYEKNIQLFLDWVSPFVRKYREGEQLGVYQYEEDREESVVVWAGGKLVVTPLPEPTSAAEWKEWCDKTPSEET